MCKEAKEVEQREQGWRRDGAWLKKAWHRAERLKKAWHKEERPRCNASFNLSHASFNLSHASFN